jgi:hypothetical protein
LVSLSLSLSLSLSYLSLTLFPTSKGQSYSWGGNISLPSQEIPRIVRNPKVHYCISLLHSQAPATCPYPEPDQSSTCLSTPLLNTRLLLYLPLRLDLVSGLQSSGSPTRSVSFIQVSQPNSCMNLSCLPYVPHVPPISFFSIWSPK